MEGSIGSYYWKHKIRMKFRRNFEGSKELIGIGHGVLSIALCCLIFPWYIFNMAAIEGSGLEVGSARRACMGEEEIPCDHCYKSAQGD